MTPRVKYIILSIVAIIFSLIIFMPLVLKNYDKNDFIFIIEQAFKKKKEIKNKVFILNIEDRINSEVLLNTLFLLSDITVDSIFIDVNFKNLSDTIYLDNIKKLINENKKINGFILLEDRKGIKFIDRNYSKNDILQKKFTYLKTSESFLYASYLKDIRFDNIFQINPEKVGFIVDYKNIRDTFDIIYKFENKFLVSLALLKYFNDLNIPLTAVDFDLLSAKHNKNKIIKYDQKGKASFLNSIKSNPSVIIDNFIEWNNNLTNRQTITENFLKLNLISTKATNFDGYIYDEQLIDNIYNIPQFKNNEDNNLLNLTKEIAAQWKSFKNFKKDLLNNSIVFIIDSGNFNFFNNFISELNILNNGKNLNKIPIIFLFFILLILIASIFVINIFTKKIYQTILINTILLILNIGLFFILRFLLNTDYIFIVLLIEYIWTSVTVVILKIIEKRLWFEGVINIYKGEISSDHAKIISNLWREKKINFESVNVLTHFIFVDISTLIDKESSEENIDSIESKSLEIENIIKNNYGIISSVTPVYILGYFENPKIEKSNVFSAINSAQEIENLHISLETVKHYLTIAIHSKYEWFRFIKKGNIDYWTHLGASLTILIEMNKIAKILEIPIIVSENVFKQCNFKIPVRMISKIKLEGIKEPIRLFELLSQKKIDEFDRLYDYFHAGLKLFESRKWNEASQYFTQCLKINENDKISKIYLEKCIKFISNPPSQEWDGIIDF